MAMGCEDDGRARGGYNNKDKNDILMPHARERKTSNKTDNSPSCLEQLFYNLVIRNLRDICSPIIQPPQYVNLYQMCLVSRELRDN